jgi:hypothetical protein
MVFFFKSFFLGGVGSNDTGKEGRDFAAGAPVMRGWEG